MYASFLLAILAAGAASPTVEQATRAYRAGRYAVACPLFQKAVDEAPTDADRWADLGLCLGKLGRKADAVAAEIRAAELGGPETRLHAYYNLGALGVRLPLPDVQRPNEFETACKQLPSSGTCREQVSACGYSDDSGSGTGYLDVKTGWLFCPPGVRNERYFSGSDDPSQRVCFTLELHSLSMDRCRHYCESGDEDCERGERECAEQERAQETDRHCSVVFIDGCRHRAGAVCTDGGRRKAIEVAPGGRAGEH